MTPWLDDGDVRLYHGDALEQLALMPSESVQCIVTSPPFWGLRDYGTGSWSGGDADCDHVERQARQDAVRETPGGRGGSFADSPIGFRDVCGKCGATRVDQQIGLEETPDAWCARLVAVMREARRVLRNDGVCWLECGDTYAANVGNGFNVDGRAKQGTLDSRILNRVQHPFKPKDLVGAPWLLAFALRADGWYLRSDTIWARPNPMPESVTDRPTKAHSYVFLLTKAARYFYDADAIREDSSRPEMAGRPNGHAGRPDKGAPVGQSAHSTYAKTAPSNRNARSVWSIATEPTPFAHFATFPQALVERCVKAGTSEHGCCGECGAPWRRITGQTGERQDRRSATNALADEVGGTHRERTTTRVMETLGWAPSCECREEPLPGYRPCSFPRVPCVVLDPFMGSGTTALVARRLGRHAIGIELNLSYLAISATRLQQLSLLGGHA